MIKKIPVIHLKVRLVYKVAKISFVRYIENVKIPILEIIFLYSNVFDRKCDDSLDLRPLDEYIS